MIRLGVYSFHINQYSITKSQLAAELGPAQPQLVYEFFQTMSCNVRVLLRPSHIEDIMIHIAVSNIWKHF